jgi:hypothetical protein
MVYRGARVRLTWNSPPRWIDATVDNPSSRALSLVTSEEPLGTIIINESTRLQLYQGRRSPTKLSAAIGAVVGGSLSGLLFRNSFGRDETAFATSQAIVVGAAAGALLGTMLGVSVLGHAQWADVPIERGHIVYPPLDPSSSNVIEASFSIRQWWTRFDPTESTFEAFFQEYQPRLHAIEGVYWNAREGGRAAIVRDNRYPEFQYVMVNLQQEARFPIGREIGEIVAVIRVVEPSRYEIRYVPSTSPLTYPAQLTAESLNILRRGTTEQWVRARQP